jgi:Dolichyl-phosphate-mannose-protein mannosyltransferase
MCRLVTLVCGMASLALLWLAVRALFPGDGELAMLVVAFGALWPLHQNVGAAAGNDATADLICSAIFYLIARGASRLQQGHAWPGRDALALGVLLGLGMLTKNTCLVIVPAALGAAWVYAASAQPEAAKRAASLKAVAQSLGMAALVCGWWLARNQRLYGDPLAAKIFDVAFRNSSLRPSAYFSAEAAAAFGQQVTLFIYLRALLLVLFCTTWGVFGGPNTAIKIINPFAVGGPAPQAVAGLPPLLICLAATLLAGWGLWRWRQHDWPALPALVRAALAWWLVGAVLVAFALVQFNLIQFQGQARYLHPAFLPLALCFCLGWRRAWRQLGGRWLWPASAAFGLTLLYTTLWNVLAWRTLV